MTPSALGELRPTIAYYFPIVFFGGGIFLNLYGVFLWFLPTSAVGVVGIVLCAVLLAVYLRFARTAELTATTISWRGMIDGGELDVARLTGVRGSYFTGVVISTDDREVRLPGSRCTADLVVALKHLRPDLPVTGTVDRSFWLNVSTHKFVA